MDKKVLNDDLRELRIEHKMLIDKSKKNHSKIKRLKLQTKTACNQFKSTEKQFEKYKNEIKIKLKEIEDKYKNMLKDRETKYKSIEHENSQHIDRIHQLQNEIVILQRDRENCIEFHVNRKDFDLLQNELNSIKDKYHESESNLLELQNVANKVIKEIENIRTMNEKLENKCIEYKQEITNLNKQINQITKDNRFKDKESKALSSKIEKLQQEYNKAREQRNDIKTIKLNFETEKNLLHQKITKYIEQTEILHIRIQSLSRRYDTEKSNAKMWKLKLKTFVEQQQHRNATISEWLSQCGQNKCKYDAKDHEYNHNEKIGDNEDNDDEVHNQ